MIAAAVRPRRASGACRATGRGGRRRRRRAASSASATSTVRLPSTRSSPAGLPVVAGVAEDAEQVVAQLERLAERQPEGGQRRRASPARRRRGRRRRAAAARWSTSPTCSAARSSRCRRRRGRAPAPTRRGTGRRSPRCGTGRRPRAPARPGPSGSPQRRSSSSAQPSSRSPSRIAAAAPYCSGSPRQPAARCSASNARWVAGRPRRVSEASIRSSWASALACSSSSAAQARSSARLVGRAAARPRGSPSSRTPPGTSCRRPPPSGPRRAAARRRSRAEPGARACSSRKLVERRVCSAAAEAGAVPGRVRRSRHARER